MLRRHALLGLPALLAACRSPEPVLYTLLPVPGEPRRGGPRAVTLREVALAGYLDRQQIVKNADGYRLDVAGNDWWAESLGAMSTRVLVENLAQRLPSSSVIASSGAITAPPDVTVEVNLQRLGLTGAGALTLTAQVATRWREQTRRDATRSVSVPVTLAGTDTAAFVSAASQGYGQLADAIAGMLG